MDRRSGPAQPCGDVLGMGALLNLADGPEAQLLQGLVIEFAAVVVAHARTRPDPDHKVNLLVNGLVGYAAIVDGRGLRAAWRCSPSTGDR
jgi:hypothetical protein